MAKKKKASKKAVGSKGKAAKRKAPRRSSNEPRPVKTGKGASAMELGQRLVAMFNSRTPDEQIWRELFSKTFQSVEGMGMEMMWEGVQAAKAKADWWHQDHTVHAASAEGPFVGSTGFAVRFTMDVETMSTGEREVTQEVGVYTVRDGKIVREEFMYKA
jgi:hypothetical protein